ncbi:hypothetical protein FRC10_010695 [Ceratobasidium sp. 414]|nr:hypothetical protein FRC10_010695 [Ceratobasidium sp. 414]
MVTKPSFFTQLLERDEHDVDMERVFEDFNGMKVDSPEGSELGVDDVSFGIPEANEPVNEPMQFDFDEDLEHEPEDEPEDKPSANDVAEPDCAAFNKPDVIRNTYVDAFVQKTRFHATHAALKRQLKSARCTISANPNVSPAEIENLEEHGARTRRTTDHEAVVARKVALKGPGGVRVFEHAKTGCWAGRFLGSGAGVGSSSSLDVRDVPANLAFAHGGGSQGTEPRPASHPYSESVGTLLIPRSSDEAHNISGPKVYDLGQRNLVEFTD